MDQLFSMILKHFN